MDEKNINDYKFNSKDKISKPIDFIAKVYYQIYKTLKERIDKNIDNEYEYLFDLENEKYRDNILSDEEKIELELYTIFRFIHQIVPSNENNYQEALRIYNLLLTLKEKNDWRKHDINRIKDEINMIYILCDKKPPFLKRIYDRCCYVLFNKNDNNKKMR